MSREEVSLGFACRSCMGTGYLRAGHGDRTHCPVCGGSGPLHELAQTYSINWSDQKSQYDVSFTLGRSVGASGREPETILKLIAERSVCKCGSKLTQRSHNLSVTGEQLTVTAAFVCSSCNSGGSTFLSRAKYNIGKALGQIKKVKVGKDGVELERMDRKNDEA